MPLTVPVPRVLEACRCERIEGPLVLGLAGRSAGVCCLQSACQDRRVSDERVTVEGRVFSGEYCPDTGQVLLRWHVAQ